MSLRIVMMGTGTFALPAFRGLYETDHRIVGLFTQPDRTGRGHHHHPHPVKEAAIEQGTPVFQPENVNTPESLDQLRSLEPDLCVVAAYGQLLSRELLDTPRMGAVNLHASLLPKYRGAAPVQFAVLRGEEETGVTIFQIVPSLDAGPILGVVKTPIGPQETSGELETRLAQLAVPLTREVVDRIEQGTAVPIVQDGAEVTRAPRLKKTDGLIDWSRSPRPIDCHVRGMQPWPRAFCFVERPGQSPLRVIVQSVAPHGEPTAVPPGHVVASEHGRLTIASGDGTVEILRIQPEGKRSMNAAEFLNGHTFAPGDRFAAEPPA